MYLRWAKTGLATNQLPLSEMPPLLLKYLRFDVWGTLFCFAILFSSISLFWRKQRGHQLDRGLILSMYPILFFLLIVLLLSIVFGRAEPISFYRFTTFSYAPMLCFSLLLLATALRTRLAGVWMTAVVSIFLAWQYQTSNHIGSYVHSLVQQSSGNMAYVPIREVVKNGVRLMKGKYSIADAYQHQKGWPGRMAWGGIYPAALEVWKRLPPNTRIWSLHVHSYCMLPDCHMEGFMSYRFSPHAEEIYFGDPQIAKAWLKKENLNYFFISHKLSINDPLPLSPLFSPQHIGEHFGIVWTDGNSSLLTWKENTKLAIDSEWLRRYQKRVAESEMVRTFPIESVRVFMQRFREKGSLVS